MHTQNTFLASAQLKGCWKALAVSPASAKPPPRRRVVVRPPPTYPARSAVIFRCKETCGTNRQTVDMAFKRAAVEKVISSKASVAIVRKDALGLHATLEHVANVPGSNFTATPLWFRRVLMKTSLCRSNRHPGSTRTTLIKTDLDVTLVPAGIEHRQVTFLGLEIAAAAYRN